MVISEALITFADAVDEVSSVFESLFEDVVISVATVELSVVFDEHAAMDKTRADATESDNTFKNFLFSIVVYLPSML